MPPTDRELMQRALEGLEAAYEGQIWLSHLPDVITALRERLAQPEPAPGYCQHCKQYTIEEPLPAQPEQEPFAWADESAIRWLADRKGKTSAHCTTKLSAARSFEKPMPIYTTPPRREWVGLTDEEKAELDAEYGDDTLAHLDAIEAKLKEKNNG